MGLLTPAWGSRLLAAGTAFLLLFLPVVFDPRLYDDFTLPKQALLLGVCLAVLLPALLATGIALPPSRIFRWTLCALGIWILITWIAGVDPRGSVLGVYQYRQGMLTWVCYAILLLTGLRLAKDGRGVAWISWPLGVALALVAGYATLQGAGLDPVDWWLDTSVRPISSIGNANELSSFAIICLLLCGAAAARGKWARSGVCFAAAATVGFVVLETQSRSGLAAIWLGVAVLPLTGRIARVNWSVIARQSLLVTAGCLAGFAVSGLVSSAPNEAAGRVRAGIAGNDASGSTRVALIDGTLETIEDDPLFGAGPDGLYLEFPRNRPPGLTGVFEETDLVVQSSHNSILDLASNLGLPGLGLMLTLVAYVAVTMARSRSGGVEAMHRSSALTAYVAMTLLNPLSLAAHAVFWLVLGWSLGRASPASSLRIITFASPMPKFALATAGIVTGLAAMVILPLADLKADEAWDSYARRDFATAAQEYGEAHDLLPVVRDYDSRRARSWLAAGINGDTSALIQAETTLLAFDGRYGMGFDEAIALATARIGLDEPISEVDGAVALAVELNPNGVYTEDYAARLREAARVGGTLHYEDERHWVYVDPVVAEPAFEPQ